ncbi:tRNA methyltransferase 10 homolog A isoform X2 [Cylas formicarius]|uniref:tRNA methyltransferase 10 homolog A isoform X2 n=1 Tax=Cylas formicarius TaxID=197179 RepID=UPI0029586BC0|nr:tRNA methyltransferase 10 homolog A isoform X2 [Cylas formicarius]
MESEKLFNGVEISKLSKKQLKKYHKSLKWDEIKRKKRALEKQRSKEKRSFAKLHNIDIGPSRKELKRKKMVKSSCDIAVCIDLSFDHLMIDKDMAKAIKQVLRVYTVNRRARQPMQLHLTSFGGRSKEEMTRHHGYENWDINFHERDYLDVFPKDKLVYLSSESENVINQLEPGKGLCHRKAVEQGIAHGQLPIGDYFRLQHRKVITINQVFEILVQVSEGKSFKEALEIVLPKRFGKIQLPHTEPDKD